MKKSNNYKSRAPKVPKVVKHQEPEPESVQKSVPLPPGIRDVLLAKVRLLKKLIDEIGNPVSVSIEVYEQEWVLLVHGPKPPARYFEGYKVFWARSKVLGK